MSYANVAASGPKQTAAEVRRAPAPPQVEPVQDSSTSSLVDVDSPHVSTVPSDYSSQEVKTDTQAERQRLEQEARDKASEVKDKAAQKKKRAEAKAKDIGQTLRANSDNPVFVGNAVTIAALGGVIGFGAYRKYVAGELTWRVAGLWAGAVGLFGVADYYVSQYFFKKYPPK